MSYHSSPDGPVSPGFSTTTADANAAHNPVPKDPLRTVVSDGSVTIFVAGPPLEQPAAG